MSSGELMNSRMEADNVLYEMINFTVTLTGNTTDTLITCKADSNVQPYVEIGGVQPSTSGTGLLLLTDSGANFPTLDSNASPTVWGLLLTVRDADPLYTPTLEVLIKPSASTDTISLRGNATTGITVNNNVAFSISSAGIDLDAAAASFVWRMRVTYKRLLSVKG